MQTIAHFNLLERLGSGALGEVHRARDLKVGRTVALMAPPVELTDAPGRREQFLQQARAATALNHPNIAMLFDVVEQDGRCYLAYEFVAGPSLRDEMGGSPVNMRRAIELGAQIADALAEGHSRGLVHGDLRPENVVVTHKGSPKILNFGLANWTTGGQARAAAATATGLGSDPHGVAGYLSPEQAIGGPIDERSDVFSFGVILHEMLTGSSPFAGATPAATVMNVIGQAPLAPSQVKPGITRELDTIVARSLAKPVDARSSGALSLSSELRRIAALLDAREGTAAPAELIPIVPERKNAWWIALVIALVVLGAMWWML
jgi:serine/threonine protein kinase